LTLLVLLTFVLFLVVLHYSCKHVRLPHVFFSFSTIAIHASYYYWANYCSYCC